jgi:probable rRNA maturation factor
MRKPERLLAIANRQRRARPRRDDIRAIVDRVLDREGVAGGIEIALVGERTIRRLHRDWLNDDTVTDVISFPWGKPVPGPDASGVAVGEVIVCVPVCECAARSLGVSLHDEIARMLIHGILHVVGYDHDTPVKNRRMRAIERRHLAWYRGSGLRVVDAVGVRHPGR